MPPTPDITAAVAGRAPDVIGDGGEGRRTHYGHFYDRLPVPEGAGLVVGNCQAESLRIVIDTPDTPAVRVPPVHELEPADVAHLDRLVAGAAFVVSQPIRDDYRGLPVGTRQLRERARPDARFVVVPSVRFAGLHPFQLALHVPGHPDPPLVAYQDVRDLAAAAGLAVRPTLSAEAVRSIAADSVAELRRREVEADAVPVSDVFAEPTFDHSRTVNHAGNPVWRALGARVLRALGSDADPVDPGRPLLSSVIAAREAWVAEAWGLTGPVSDDWVVDGVTVPASEVRDAHLRWYSERPDYVDAALTRAAGILPWWVRS